MFGHDYEFDQDHVDQLRRELISIPCAVFKRRALASYSMHDCEVSDSEKQTFLGGVCLDKHCVFGHKKGPEV